MFRSQNRRRVHLAFVTRSECSPESGKIGHVGFSISKYCARSRTRGSLARWGRRSAAILIKLDFVRTHIDKISRIFFDRTQYFHTTCDNCRERWYTRDKIRSHARWCPVCVTTAASRINPPSPMTSLANYTSVIAQSVVENFVGSMVVVATTTTVTRCVAF